MQKLQVWSKYNTDGRCTMKEKKYALQRRIGVLWVCGFGGNSQGFPLRIGWVGGLKSNPCGSPGDGKWAWAPCPQLLLVIELQNKWRRRGAEGGGNLGRGRRTASNIGQFQVHHHRYQLTSWRSNIRCCRTTSLEQTSYTCPSTWFFLGHLSPQTENVFNCSRLSV